MDQEIQVPLSLQQTEDEPLLLGNMRITKNSIQYLGGYQVLSLLGTD